MGYDPESKTLAVELKTGHIYHHEGVSTEQHAEMLAAPSVGSFFGKEIRPQSPGVKVTGECNKCGDVGALGDTCVDCGVGVYVSRP